MATPAQWFHGARPRTLPAAVAPVLVGSAVAWWLESFIVSRALLALVVALALQVGVNYANDYSDGVRGTDDARATTGGPVRLVGQRLAHAHHVKVAAFSSFGVAALAGLSLVIATGQWWLIGAGVACIAAAWFYTGGTRPYGYAGLGEVFVFVFFGVVAVVGTTYVQTEQFSGLALLLSVGVGAYACAILVANNLRDRAADEQAGKLTLAVRLGDARTRRLYVALIAVGIVIPVVVTVFASALPDLDWPMAAGLGAFAGFVMRGPVRIVRSGASGRDLVAVLAGTGLGQLVGAVLTSAGTLLPLN
jgi:1,4-dihydroxy-2-naphthoate polyprenyltransferase